MIRTSMAQTVQYAYNIVGIQNFTDKSAVGLFAHAQYV